MLDTPFPSQKYRYLNEIEVKSIIELKTIKYVNNNYLEEK